jgi:transposase
MIDSINTLTRDELIVLVSRLLEENQKLHDRINLLEEKLAAATKNSSNSSKPPSSDIVKPPKPNLPSGKKRKQGAQPGHQKHESMLTAQDADRTKHYTLTCCPFCKSTELQPRTDITPTIKLQYELVDNPVGLTAHMALAYWCQNCQCIHYAPLPDAVDNAGLVGHRLAAFIAILKGGCHASVATTQKVIEYLGAPLATGTICNTLSVVSQALEAPYTELLEQLPQQAALNIDETGHKDKGTKHWIWCFVASAFTVFKIATTRSTQVLLDVLGTQCAAVIGSDFYGAYRKYMKQAPVLVQFCMAHLIRELVFLSELQNAACSRYGTILLKQIKEIFALIHSRDELDEELFQKRMKKLQMKFLHNARNTRAGGAAATLAKRFKTHGQEYFTFVLYPCIEPTNNTAERAIRFCVIDRRVTQGTRGINGQRWCERIWTTIATCAQQKKNAFDYIENAVGCYFSNKPAPSLLA